MHPGALNNTAAAGGWMPQGHHKPEHSSAGSTFLWRKYLLQWGPKATISNSSYYSFTAVIPKFNPLVLLLLCQKWWKIYKQVVWWEQNNLCIVHGKQMHAAEAELGGRAGALALFSFLHSSLPCMSQMKSESDISQTFISDKYKRETLYITECVKREHHTENQKVALCFKNEHCDQATLLRNYMKNRHLDRNYCSE